MAKPIQNISPNVVTERDQETESLEQLISAVAMNRESLEETISLLNELHASGLLEAIRAMLLAREQVAKILVEQAMRPEATALINNLMNALGGFTKIDPEMTGRLMAGFAQGMEAGQKSGDSDKKLRMFDLMRAMKDPDINRTLRFAIGFLGGFGKAL